MTDPSTVAQAPAKVRAAELLTWVARSATGSHQATPDLAAVSSDEWSAFLRASLDHGVVPLAARAVLAAPIGVPEAMLVDLHQALESTARRSLTMTAELVGLLRLLGDAGIRAVPWKGPLLAQRAYGDVSARSFFDLDVLVRPEQLAVARDLLLARGFAPQKSMTDAQQLAYVDHQGELELVRHSDSLWVELHTAIVPNYYAAGTRADELWTRLEPARLAGTSLNALSLVDELEALCVHGSKHRWQRLIWIIDVARMAQLMTAPEWRLIADRSAGHGTARMVHLGLLLAMGLCRVEVPAPTAAAARSDVAARRLAAETRHELFAPREHRFEALLYHARMRERSRDRLRYLVSVLYTPSGADWERIALPRALFPLYTLTRPFRLALKYGWRLIAGARG